MYEKYSMWEKSLYSKINWKKNMLKAKKKVSVLRYIKNEKLTYQLYMLQIL